MSWFDTLKMVYTKDAWRIGEDYPMSKDNPHVILTASKLPGEVWEEKHEKGGKKSYGRSWHVTTTAPPTKDRLVSNYGRVKENGIIVEPENTKFGFGVNFKGMKRDYKQHRYKSSREGSGEKTQTHSGYVFIKWFITVDWAEDNGISIPDSDKLFAYGRPLGTYGEFVKEYMGSREGE